MNTVTKRDLAQAADILENFIDHNGELTEYEKSLQRVIEFLEANITEMRKQNAGA